MPKQAGVALIFYKMGEESPGFLPAFSGDKKVAANSRPPWGARCEQKRFGSKESNDPARDQPSNKPRTYPERSEEWNG